MDRSEVDTNEDKAPILGTWNKLYIFVIVLHFVIISLFVLFSFSYS